MITVSANAKINLTLEALSRRPDGYHEIKSIVQEVSLYDTLELRPDEGMVIRSDDVFWLAEESLVPRAAELLRQASGFTGGAAIHIHKAVPLLSGLGGDSSDAAAALTGLNRLWETGLSSREMGRLAGQLGSDVSFFLHGGTALVTGRGEAIQPLPPVQPFRVVLLLAQVPRAMGKTGRLYSRLAAGDYTDGRATDKLAALVRKGGRIGSGDLFNIFEKVAYQEFDGLEGYRRLFLKAGAVRVHLAGSGPTLFTLVQDDKNADKIYNNLTKSGLQAVVVKTVARVE